MSCPGIEGWSEVGLVVGESTPARSVVLFSQLGPSSRTGLFVASSNGEGCVLGTVERVSSGNVLVPGDISDFREASMLSQIPEARERIHTRGVVRWLSLLEPLEREGRVVSPSLPVPPASTVHRVPSDVLRGIFSGEGPQWVRIGSLVTDPGVEYRVNVDKLMRHLAILAVTGGGKSNTVCTLFGRVVDELGGTVVIFDVHGEYASGKIAGRQRVLPPRINPWDLSFYELVRLMRIPSNAHNQERILREAFTEARSKYKEQQVPGGDFKRAMKSILESKRGSGGKAKGEDRRALDGVLNRFEDMEYYYGDVLDPSTPRDLESLIEPGSLTVFDLSDVDEVGADAVVSHYLRRLLNSRKLYRAGKGGYPVPVIVVIEEAHVLVPAGRDTLTREQAARIAREGRKFGLGLVLVSQRPKNVDADVLSQTNNKIILKIVEPSDQGYVQRTSEQLSEDLVSMLPSLNPGEAVVIGSMTKLPALVKIDFCGGKGQGTDIRVAEEWARYRRESEEAVKEALGYW